MRDYLLDPLGEINHKFSALTGGKCNLYTPYADIVKSERIWPDGQQQQKIT